MSIYVIGYYGHCNFGDEQYKESFKILLQREDIQFIDCDCIHNFIFNDTDIIILGGGDVLNNYFINPLYSKFNGKPNKIIAISVGIPYLDIVLSNYKKLEIFSAIYTRSYQDITLLCDYFPREHIYYLPDISKVLVADTHLITSQIIKQKRQKHAGICLSRHVYHQENIENYYNIINSIKVFIVKLIKEGYNVTLLPFNTNINNSFENDLIIQEDVMGLIPQSMGKNITVIHNTLSIAEINKLFKTFSVVFPMRFHACLFSVYHNIPFIPIITTRKITNLLNDIDWHLFYNLNNKDINISTIKNLLIQLEDNYAYKVKKIMDINDNFTKNIKKYKPTSILMNEQSRMKNIINNTFQEKVNAILCKLNEYTYPEVFPNISIDKQKYCVQLLCYYLVGHINTKYNYGLCEKMFHENYNYYEEWQWVYNDNLKLSQGTTSKNNNSGLYNINYINQHDYSNVHRSGWEYVTKAISVFSSTSTNVVLLDLYTDRSFHWDNKINKMVDIIPYTQNWKGIIHHTFDETFSDYNNTVLFKTPEFINSLKYCSGIIVLSKYLANQLKSALADMGFSNIPIHSIKHPTDINVPSFSMDSFIQNPNKQIIHVGGWLRNIYSFYTTIIPKHIKYRKWFWSKKTSLPIQKSILHGVHMNNYFPEIDMIENIKKSLCKNTTITNKQTTASRNPNVSISPEQVYNNWYLHMIEDLQYKLESVNHISHVNDTLYDEILTNNIIFINLVDASAINTLIECIVRNTPIIINKHPAVVELLGEHYPLYYTNNQEMSIQVFNLIKYKNIKKAHQCLKKINKKDYDINTFIAKFNNLFK